MNYNNILFKIIKKHYYVEENKESGFAIVFLYLLYYGLIILLSVVAFDRKSCSTYFVESEHVFSTTNGIFDNFVM